jgi:HCOMODA/2-hydroxy-3-carboxy-muconic semialdehyde decarboxylase
MAVLHTARVLGALLGSTPIERSVIDDLVAANRILANQQVVDAFGHVSVRHRSNAQRFLMGRNLAPALVTANDIVEYDLDGNAIGAKPGFTHILERFIHAEIYYSLGRELCGAQPFVSDYSICKHTGATQTDVSHCGVSCAECADLEISQATGAMTNMLIADGKLGQSLAETLGQNAVMYDARPWWCHSRGFSHLLYSERSPDINANANAGDGCRRAITFLDLEEAEKATKVIDQIRRAWDLWSAAGSAD